jgi:hypothetical protein
MESEGMKLVGRWLRVAQLMDGEESPGMQARIVEFHPEGQCFELREPGGPAQAQDWSEGPEGLRIGGRLYALRLDDRLRLEDEDGSGAVYERLPAAGFPALGLGPQPRAMRSTPEYASQDLEALHGEMLEALMRDGCWSCAGLADVKLSWRRAYGGGERAQLSLQLGARLKAALQGEALGASSVAERVFGTLAQAPAGEVLTLPLLSLWCQDLPGRYRFDGGGSPQPPMREPMRTLLAKPAAALPFEKGN